MKPPSPSQTQNKCVTTQETSDQLLAAILDLSAGDRRTGRGAVNGGVNFAEQTSQDILEVIILILIVIIFIVYVMRYNLSSLVVHQVGRNITENVSAVRCLSEN